MKSLNSSSCALQKEPDLNLTYFAERRKESGFDGKLEDLTDDSPIYYLVPVPFRQHTPLFQGFKDYEEDFKTALFMRLRRY